MSNRLEYKYLVPNEFLNDIRADMKPFVEIDGFASKQQKKEYTVRSIYYDTPGFECYHEKVEGLKVRKKFRIRGYDTPGRDSIVFLEIKRKYQNFIEKNRAPLLHANLKKMFITHNFENYIISFSGNGVEKSDAQRFFYHYYRKSLRPAVLVIYDREAFFGKFNKALRFTFDKNLRSSSFPSQDMLYEEHQVKYAIRKNFIFEVKFFNGLPAWIQSIIKKYQLQRMALSKYTICLDSHNAVQQFSKNVFSNTFPNEYQYN